MASTISFGDANSGFQAGIVNGPVHADFHLPPERPETPPEPSSHVPFRRDAHFVQRGTLLDQINEKCTVPGSWTALVGLGGVGKSQLAIEYAYRVRDRSPQTWVLWVHASNAARFKQSYQDIADRLKLSGRSNPRANVFKLVHDWLQNSKGPWLLILDNVDDARFLLEAEPRSDVPVSLEPAPRRLRDYLPQSQSGAILVTTRSRQAALQLVEQNDNITVEPMDEEEAITLLKTKLRVREEDGDETIVQLAETLDFMPLAIVQAAAYISQRMPRYSMRQYLDDFVKGDRKIISLLNYKGGQLRRDVEAKNSIIITWQISFDYIRDIRPSAADLLSLMSLFDRQGIPESLLWNRDKHGNTQQEEIEQEIDEDKDEISQSDVSDAFEEDVIVLRNFSFIFDDSDGTSFEMHRLVQLATRQWLQARGQLEKWKEQLSKNLCGELPTGAYENWSQCQALFPHVKAAAAQRPKDQAALRDWATIMFRAAWYADDVGNWLEAEEMSTLSLKVRAELLGQEHEDTLASKAMLGSVYRFRGQWDAAEELFVQVMETSKKKLGTDHPDTLTSMSNLASTFRDQGRWEAAEELDVQVMETSKKKLGAEHPDTLISMANLASTYRNQGRWDAAEELFVQVMETRKKKLGTDHPSTMNSMNNLAFTWYEQGRINDAVALISECVLLQTRVLGVTHPYTLSSLVTLNHWKAS